MMKRIAIVMVLTAVASVGMAQRVTIRAVDEPAASVFRTLISQTGKNFVYASEILDGVRVSVTACDRPLHKVLDEMFRGTGIEYKIKGNDVVLKRRRSMRKDGTRLPSLPAKPVVSDTLSAPAMLEEVVVVSRIDAPAVATAEIGASKITAEAVRSTPVLFGESDVIKTLQTQPGVADGTEGMAGMHVHGGGSDENLYMLDNVPLYHVNHFAGLFSAFNTDIIRYVDFFKSSVPAKYDGRLSSFMDVRLQNGRRDGHHGSARLGLAAGSFNMSGSIGRNTTYMVGVRRSWYDVLTIPALAIINANQDEKINLHYYFMDLNGKMSHRFSDRLTGFVSVYFGDDMFRNRSKDESDGESGWNDNEKYNFHWGNIVAQTGLNYRVNQNMTAEFTAAYTRYYSRMTHDYESRWHNGTGTVSSNEMAKTDNNINDWIFRGDFDWQAADNSRVRFGAGYTRHSFLPARTVREYDREGVHTVSRDSTWAYGANEFNGYVEDDWRVDDRFRINAGLHLSLFGIDRKVKYGVSPRLSLSYRPMDNVAFKGAYSRTVQYVHQLAQSYMALPTDQWIPVTGGFKPQTADKVAAGVYWQSPGSGYSASVEGYFKWMHNLVDYRDEYYLKPPMEMWNARLTSGRGTAKGIDIKVEKSDGRLTGHIAYSLAWADRTFVGKNGGRKFPARFDNRHTIKVLIGWKVSDNVQVNASWTGHSGNRFTLLSQVWETPSFGSADGWSYVAPVVAPINGYRLPFYHRLDLSCTVRRRKGYWTFSLYNAYNHLNTIAVRLSYRDEVVSTPNGTSYSSRPVFQKVKMLPIIPSISYTWLF